MNRQKSKKGQLIVSPNMKFALKKKTNLRNKNYDNSSSFSSESEQENNYPTKLSAQKTKKYPQQRFNTINDPYYDKTDDLLYSSPYNSNSKQNRFQPNLSSIKKQQQFLDLNEESYQDIDYQKELKKVKKQLKEQQARSHLLARESSEYKTENDQLTSDLKKSEIKCKQLLEKVSGSQLKINELNYLNKQIMQELQKQKTDDKDYVHRLKSNFEILKEKYQIQQHNFDDKSEKLIDILQKLQQLVSKNTPSKKTVNQAQFRLFNTFDHTLEQAIDILGDRIDISTIRENDTFKPIVEASFRMKEQENENIQLREKVDQLESELKQESNHTQEMLPKYRDALERLKQNSKLMKENINELRHQKELDQNAIEKLQQSNKKLSLQNKELTNQYEYMDRKLEEFENLDQQQSLKQQKKLHFLENEKQELVSQLDDCKIVIKEQEERIQILQIQYQESQQNLEHYLNHNEQQQQQQQFFASFAGDKQSQQQQQQQQKYYINSAKKSRYSQNNQQEISQNLYDVDNKNNNINKFNNQRISNGDKELSDMDIFEEDQDFKKYKKQQQQYNNYIDGDENEEYFNNNNNQDISDINQQLEDIIYKSNQVSAKKLQQLAKSCSVDKLMKKIQESADKKTKRKQQELENQLLLSANSTKSKRRSNKKLKQSSSRKNFEMQEQILQDRLFKEKNKSQKKIQKDIDTIDMEIDAIKQSLQQELLDLKNQTPEESYSNEQDLIEDE